MAELALSVDKVCAVIETLRELGGMIGAEGDRMPEPADDSPLGTMEERGDDPRSSEMLQLVSGLNAGERTDLVALVLLGREEFSLEAWDAARAEARDRLEAGGLAALADLLLGDPATPEFIEAGLESFGRSCEAWDAEIIAPAPEGIAAGLPSSTEEVSAAEAADLGDTGQKQSPGLPPSIDLHRVAGASSPEARAPEASKTPEGMLGDETMEQNLGQKGQPSAGVTRADVEAAFAGEKPGSPRKAKPSVGTNRPRRGAKRRDG